MCVIGFLFLLPKIQCFLPNPKKGKSQHRKRKRERESFCELVECCGSHCIYTGMCRGSSKHEPYVFHQNELS